MDNDPIAHATYVILGLRVWGWILVGFGGLMLLARIASVSAGI